MHVSEPGLFGGGDAAARSAGDAKLEPQLGRRCGSSKFPEKS